MTRHRPPCGLSMAPSSSPSPSILRAPFCHFHSWRLSTGPVASDCTLLHFTSEWGGILQSLSAAGGKPGSAVCTVPAQVRNRTTALPTTSLFRNNGYLTTTIPAGATQHTLRSSSGTTRSTTRARR